jgi:hypothetical protein
MYNAVARLMYGSLFAATFAPRCSSTKVSCFTECIILMGVWDSVVVFDDCCKGIVLKLCRNKDGRSQFTFGGIALLTVPANAVPIFA